MTAWTDGSHIPPSCRERFLPLAQPNLAGLRASGLQMAGVSELFPPYRISRLNPRYSVALYTLAGEARLETDAGEFRLTPETLWISRPGRRHRYWAGPTWELLWFHFSPDAAWPVVECALAEPVRRPEFAVLAPLLRACIAEALHPPTGENTGVVRAYAGLLDAYFAREFRGGPETGDSHARRRLRQLLNTVDADLTRRWTLAELARQLHVSPATLHRLTRETHGLPPLALVAHLRLARARELLSHGEFTVQETARAVGYGTPFALSRAFKRHFGLPPTRAGELPG